jgi:glycosyltransferase involved in cell wall biosynthesis
MAAAGDEVEWFCGSFPGALPEEDVDGVHVVHSGRQWTVHWKAFQRYRGRLRGHFDLVIDEINTMPFFTPLWADIPRLTLIFQLAREVWWYESRFPVNAVGYVAERVYLMGYRRIPAVTISRSTESDLRRLGFRGDITVVPIGIEAGFAIQHPKSSTPTFVYVGRLARSKRLDHVIRAFALFRSAVGTGHLNIIGTGEPGYIGSLRRLVAGLDLHEYVTFAGHLSRNDKYRLMSQARALLLASVREGWGLVVTEANSCGTPAVVYNVPGLRDSVRHGQTGLIVDSSPGAMAEAMMRLESDSALYARLANEAKAWSRGFTLERLTVRMREEIAHAVDRHPFIESATCH